MTKDDDAMPGSANVLFSRLRNATMIEMWSSGITTVLSYAEPAQGRTQAGGREPG